jgi:TRAP-type C4-dicarboxylate transport system substrate-binding protein
MKQQQPSDMPIPIFNKLIEEQANIGSKNPYWFEGHTIGAKFMYSQLAPEIEAMRKALQDKQTLTNAETRTQLRELLQAFADRNCQYNAYEDQWCRELREKIQPVNPEYEKFNETHPNHGKPTQSLTT